MRRFTWATVLAVIARVKMQLRGLVATGGSIAFVWAVASCGSRSTLDGAVLHLGPGGAEADAWEAGEVDASEDARLPPIDAEPRPDVVVTNCSTPSIQYIYLVTIENELWRFYPQAGGIVPIGTLGCASTGGATPFSMAVDRRGIAYVIYSDGELFRVSTRDASCQATTFRAPTFMTLGMGFVGDPNGATDTLFIAIDNRLETLDVATFKVTPVGPFSLLRAELSGTGDGRLYAFYSNDMGVSTAVAQVDPTTGAVIANSDLTNHPQGQDWAFGFWGGEFYLFDGYSGSGSTVTRFQPSDGSQTQVVTLSQEIVGAGVSTCAPQL